MSMVNHQIVSICICIYLSVYIWSFSCKYSCWVVVFNLSCTVSKHTCISGLVVLPQNPVDWGSFESCVVTTFWQNFTYSHSITCFSFVDRSEARIIVNSVPLKLTLSSFVFCWDLVKRKIVLLQNIKHAKLAMRRSLYEVCTVTILLTRFFHLLTWY